MNLAKPKPTETNQSMISTVRYVLHTECSSTSVAVGSSDTLQGALRKAKGILGTYYVFQYTTVGEDLLTPVFVQETAK